MDVTVTYPMASSSLNEAQPRPSAAAAQKFQEKLYDDKRAVYCQLQSALLNASSTGEIHFLPPKVCFSVTQNITRCSNHPLRTVLNSTWSTASTFERLSRRLSSSITQFCRLLGSCELYTSVCFCQLGSAFIRSFDGTRSTWPQGSNYNAVHRGGERTEGFGKHVVDNKKFSDFRPSVYRLQA